jgi:Protein of unknown function (DUF3969)
MKISVDDPNYCNFLIGTLLLGAAKCLKFRPELAESFSDVLFRPKMWQIAQDIDADQRLIEAIQLASELGDIYPTIDLNPTIDQIQSLVESVLNEVKLIGVCVVSKETGV